MFKTKKYNNEAASYPYVSAIIVAAGNSTRMGGVNKQFLLIDGVPVLIRTLKAFENSDLIKEIIISAREEDIPQIFAMVKIIRLIRSVISLKAAVRARKAFLMLLGVA